MLLPGAGLLAADTPQDDEKIVEPDFLQDGSAPAPMPHAPGRTDTILIQPPTRETPDPGKVIIVPPPPVAIPPVKELPAVPPPVPVLPQTKKPDESVVLTPSPIVPPPSVAIPPVKELPADPPPVPVLPQTQKPGESIVLTPSQPEERPQQVIAPPPAEPPTPEPPVGIEPSKQKSPLDFIPMPTSLTPDQTKPEPKQGNVPPKDPKSKPPQPTKQAKGAPLRIPPNAAKTGDLSFLKGCWRGTRPEYSSKRTITERFCFSDNKGTGKRTIKDPAYAGECYGAAKGSFDAQGRLVVTSERGYCDKGVQWGQAHMICEGSGNATPCYWNFKDVGSGASQRYKIPFVRE